MAPGDDQTIEVVTFPKGKVLFKQGERSDAAYIVHSGAIGMYREAQGHGFHARRILPHGGAYQHHAR